MNLFCMFVFCKLNKLLDWIVGKTKNCFVCTKWGTLSRKHCPLICMEKLTADPIPVENWIVGVADPLDGYREIVEVLKIPLDRSANDFRSAESEMDCCRVQRFDD